MKRNWALVLCLVCFSRGGAGAELKQKTSIAFDKYVAATEARINHGLRPGGSFLYVDSLPSEARQSSYNKLMQGEILVEKRETKGPGITPDVPDGMVHHWIGIIFIPGITLAEILPILKDYDRRLHRGYAWQRRGQHWNQSSRFSLCASAQARGPIGTAAITLSSLRTSCGERGYRSFGSWSRLKHF